MIDQSRLAEDDPMNFSVGKIVHDLMAKELTEDVKKQILEEDSNDIFIKNLFSSIHAYRSALGMAVRKRSGYL